MHRWVRLAAALAIALAGADALPGEGPHVSLVPWKVVEQGDQIRTPLVLYWIPASPDEMRRSALLTSDDLALYSSQCVAMRVVRFNDGEMLSKLGISSALPAAVLADGTSHVIARIESDQGSLTPEDVEEMVREELDRRLGMADTLLDQARQKAETGAIDEAIALYRQVWDQRCFCPRQARDANRAMKKLRAK